ncbi:MAG: 3-deoxy-manno-octulosonate cytidylyltransferase, partial [Gemmatimonadaceae bacterium]
MRTLAVIPARLGATRLPRKPLRLLGGLPLVIRVWERVLSLDVVDRCLVATDSQEVADIVDEQGAEVVMTDPSHR